MPCSYVLGSKCFVPSWTVIILFIPYFIYSGCRDNRPPPLCALPSHHIKEYIKNLQCENDAIHSYAYTKTHYPENITSEDIQCLRTNIDKISKTILLNWELINLGLYNQTRHIILATMFLKLSRMQHRLFTEPWNEELREEVITTRTLYIETINNSTYTD